jgi:cytochrome P450
MEATITLAVLLRRFEFELATPPESVGMYTGATIHTRNGLMMRVRERNSGRDVE